MNGSFQLGTAFGIPIRVHLSFLFLLPFFHPLILVALFGSVLLHELGHSLVARRLGVRVVDITLYPFGGMARLADMPETPRVELLVAVAGPAVNIVLAALAGLLYLLSASWSPGLALGAELLLKTNLALGIFNLVPAFPMDGGRVFRAWMARREDWVPATERAVRVGRMVATAMILSPLLTFVFAEDLTRYTCMLPVIGIFVLIAGLQELVAVRVRHGASPFGGLDGGGTFDPTHSKAERAAAAEAHWSAPEAAGQPGGFGGARRPKTWEQSFPRQGHQGFDSERISALERFRGRLRRPDPKDE